MYSYIILPTPYFLVFPLRLLYTIFFIITCVCPKIFPPSSATDIGFRVENQIAHYYTAADGFLSLLLLLLDPLNKSAWNVLLDKRNNIIPLQSSLPFRLVEYSRNVLVAAYAYLITGFHVIIGDFVYNFIYYKEKCMSIHHSVNHFEIVFDHKAGVQTKSLVHNWIFMPSKIQFKE